MNCANCNTSYSPVDLCFGPVGFCSVTCAEEYRSAAEKEREAAKAIGEFRDRIRRPFLKPLRDLSEKDLTSIIRRLGVKEKPSVCGQCKDWAFERGYRVCENYLSQNYGTIRDKRGKVCGKGVKR